MSVSEKTIHVQYFALLREQRGQSTEDVRTFADTTLELYEMLQSRHGFSLPADRMKVIVNETFREWGTALADGDQVVFVPPVAGG